jgi:hypothetical protein
MPNLPEGWAVVIGTVLGSLIAIFGVILTLSSNRRQRKADFQERLYFEGLHKRIAVYEDVLNTLSRMKTNKKLPRDISLNGLKVKFHVYTHALEIFEARLSLFGSPASIEIIRSLRDGLCDALVIDGDPDNDTYARDVRTGFMGCIFKARLKFAESIRTEAPVKIIDEFVHHSGGRIKHIQANRNKNNEKLHRKHDN